MSQVARDVIAKKQTTRQLAFPYVVSIVRSPQHKALDELQERAGDNLWFYVIIAQLRGPKDIVGSGKDPTGRAGEL